MSYSKFDELRESLKGDGRVYQKERAKLDFAASLWTLMERNGVSRADLADDLGKSAPWITKVLSGECNFTIETMVDLACAAGGDLCLHVGDTRGKVRWVETYHNEPQAKEVWRSFERGVVVEAEVADAAEPLAA